MTLCPQLPSGLPSGAAIPPPTWAAVTAVRVASTVRYTREMTPEPVYGLCA